MLKSEKLYGAAFITLLVIAALADSENFILWTAVAVIGFITAVVLIYIARVVEQIERGKSK